MRAKNSMIWIWAISVGLLFLGSVAELHAAKNIFHKRYVFYCGKWNNDQEIKDLKEIMHRARNAGYNGIMVQGGQFPAIMKMTPTSPIFANFPQIRAEADKLGIHLIPSYYHQLTAGQHSFQSAEAFPVRGTKFEIVGGTGLVQPAVPVAFTNGDFENGTTGWRVSGSMATVDKGTAHSGTSSIKISNNAGYTKISQSMTVKPFRAYELSVSVKTSEYEQHKWIGMTAWGRHWALHIRHPGQLTKGLAKTMGWRRCKIDFNSLDYDRLTLSIALGKASGGTVWFDNVQIREVGLYEVIRRETTPVVVKSQSGKIYQEGKDYTIEGKLIESVKDYCAESKLRIPAGSSIRDGEVVTVDWYQLANVENLRQPAGSGCHEKHWDYMRSDLKLITNLFGNDIRAWHVPIGEWREAGWDPNCPSYFGQNVTSAGPYMAAWTLKTSELVKQTNSKAEIYIKNDMYDLHHNATASNRYYMANGSLHGAWNGIPENGYVVNWRPPKGPLTKDNVAVKSYLFWAGLDPQVKIKPQKQILRMNCEGGSTGSVPVYMKLLAAAEAEGLQGMVGCIYNTWNSKYPSFSGMERAAEICKAAGRWGKNDNPFGSTAIESRNNVKKSFSGARIVKASSGFASSRAMLQYEIAEQSRVRVSLVNSQGRTVAELVNRQLSAGRHVAVWNTTEIAAGVYFVKVEALTGQSRAPMTLTQKMVSL